MALTYVTRLRVMPGKENELFEILKTVKKAVERAGGTAAVRREVTGPTPGSIIVASQYPDWSNIGKFYSDQELRKLMDIARAQSNPAAELLSSSVLEEVVI